MSATLAIAARGPVPASERKQSRIGEFRGLRARLALDRQTKKDAFPLRHLCYHSNEYIEARANRKFSDPCDAVRSNRTIVIHKDARSVASVHVCARGLERHSAALDQLLGSSRLQRPFAWRERPGIRQ